AMNKAQAAMNEVRDRKAARDRLNPQGAGEQKLVDELGQRRADMLVERAMQTDPEAVKEFDRLLDGIEKEQAVAARALEATGAAQRALQALIDAAEDRLIQMNQSPIVYTFTTHSSAVTQVLQRRLEEIVEKHLLPFALEVAAMQSATGAFFDWQDVLQVPTLGRAMHPLLTGRRSFLGGNSLALDEMWQSHPELVAAADAAAAPRMLLQQLRTLAARAAERRVHAQA
ncbi:MAG: hypothetical protein JF567_09600, partial [Xanthomonadales bacterium]|nr:hypothetical protein [Xanthomonadales bacterium]